MRTVSQALAYLNAQVIAGKAFAAGMCKRKTREAYLIASDGSTSAARAWQRTDHRVEGQWVRGAFVWWTGGSAGFGHVAVCRFRKGHILTVDYPRVGRWNATTIEELEDAWPAIRWAGMSLDIDGRKVRRLPLIRRRWAHS
jgi:hypothetical protein